MWHIWGLTGEKKMQYKLYTTKLFSFLQSLEKVLVEFSHKELFEFYNKVSILKIISDKCFFHNGSFILWILIFKFSIMELSSLNFIL